MFEEPPLPPRRPWPLLAGLALAVLGVGLGLLRTPPPAAARAPEGRTPLAAKGGRPVPFHKPSDEELKKTLSRQQYEVTQREGTEAPFRNEYWDNHAEGLYVDVVSGEPLFSSRDKFDSGTGWPSFSRPVAPDSLATATDYKIGLPRTEVRSKQADSHLGHVFDDGPAPTGQRYCINSAALRFIPADRLEAEGYGEYVKLFQGSPSPHK